MSDQPETIEQREMEQAAARLRFAIADAKSLELVQRLISSVEKVILSVVPQSYDTRPAITVARNLSEAINERESVKVSEAEDHFANELLLWRLSLCSRDEVVTPYDLRRFCEKAEQALDDKAFTALTRFYRSQSYSELARGKFDFCVTQLCTGIDEQGRRQLRVEGEPLVTRLTEMFASWELEPAPAAATEGQIREAIDGFRQFIATAQQIAEFEELISTGLFNRLRLFKSSVGEKLYLPAVTAAAMECNVVVANKFSELLARESAQIREAPDTYRNLTNVLSDTSPIGFVSGALNDLQVAELDQHAHSGAQLAQLMRLLRVSQSQTTGDDHERGGSGGETETYFVPEELSVTLTALAEDEENKEIVSMFLRTPLSEERKSIDPMTFLGRLPEDEPGAREEERQIRRGALALILKAEKLLFSKLAFDDPITTETEAELAALLEEMQQTDSTLRGLIAEARANAQLPLVDQLLHISNHLLGSRLSLQSALVARGAEELARQEQLTLQLGETAEEPRRRLFNWRIIVKYAACVIVLTACAWLTMRALTVRSTAAETRSRDVEILDVQSMPGSEGLVGARLKRPVLVVIVSSSWAGWPDEQKRDELKALLHFAEPLGANTVMLVDSGGAQRGSISDSHLILDSDPPRRNNASPAPSR